MIWTAILLGRGSQLPLPPVPAHRRVRPGAPDGRRRQGRRDPGAAPSTQRAPTSSRPTPAQLVGSGSHRHPRQTHRAGALGGVPCHPRDDLPLASHPCPTSLDLPTPTTGAPCPARRNRRADRASRQGEPALGIPANRRRASKAWRHGLERQRRQRAATPRPAAGASADRTYLGRVPSLPGRRASWPPTSSPSTR